MINLWNALITAFIVMALVADLGHEMMGMYKPTFLQRAFLWTWAGLSIFAVWCR